MSNVLNNPNAKFRTVTKAEVNQATLNLTIAFEILEGAAGAHGAHPHVLNAIEAVKDAAAEVNADLVAAAGFTPQEAHQHMLFLVEELQNFRDNLAATGRNH